MALPEKVQPRILALITNKQPWVHGIWIQDGEHNPNVTLCGIPRDVLSRFCDTSESYFGYYENEYLRDVMCGVCWWKYRSI